MLIRTTLLRLTLPVLVFLAWAPAASAWSWPVQGPVVQAFAYDAAHPYVSGQHRGVDIGADVAGAAVVAPATGTVSFAGTVPTSGRTVTIETADGYSVTLTHLGTILVADGASVAERDPVGTIGPSGTAEIAGPYVHLGIRVTADPNGYLDPLGLLPAPTAGSPPAQSGSPAPQPAVGGGSSATTPATETAPVMSTNTPAATLRGSTVTTGRSRGSRHERGRARSSRPEARQAGSSQRSATHAENARPAATPHRVTEHRHVSEPTISSRRPVVEAGAPVRQADLGAGGELQPSVSLGVPVPAAGPDAPSVLLPLVLNGAAALIAAAAALAAAHRRRRAVRGNVGAQVIQLPPPPSQLRPARRVA